MESIKVGDILLGKEELTKTIATENRGSFVVKIANPLEKKRIIRAVAAAVGEAPLTSVPASDYYYATAVETLKVVIISSPDWFKSVDDCLDDDLILKLYSEYTKFEDDFRRQLRQDRFGGSRKKP